MGMRMVVAGGTGEVGKHVVAQARAAGHDVVPLSRSSGQDVVAGRGLAEAVAGADVVVDVLSVATTSAAKATAFFRATTQHLLDAERTAGVGHHVALSIVGIDGETRGYYAGKVAQERLVEAGPVPWTVLRATQFHEFAPQMVRRTSVGPFVVVPAMRTSTVAAAEVAAALLALAEGAPRGRATDLRGPEESELADLVRRWLAATGQRRRVLRVPLPGASGRRVRDGALVPGPGADRGRQTFEQWLTEAVAQR
ncbi:SDR family oxidoreductase [Modestobacter versicolor]|uniref:SDR family oxidoreductase n=1 Tax=Modestobacter versicolor TaxID=429133 RepID=UPI0034DE7F80